MPQEILKTQVCECTNCGNEAEMHITCTLPDETAVQKAVEASEKKEKVKGHAVCQSCGNEADMWIDL